MPRTQTLELLRKFVFANERALVLTPFMRLTSLRSPGGVKTLQQQLALHPYSSRLFADQETRQLLNFLLLHFLHSIKVNGGGAASVLVVCQLVYCTYNY
jgi:hypothetical protein